MSINHVLYIHSALIAKHIFGCIILYFLGGSLTIKLRVKVEHEKDFITSFLTDVQIVETFD